MRAALAAKPSLAGSVCLALSSSVRNVAAVSDGLFSAPRPSESAFPLSGKLCSAAAVSDGLPAFSGLPERLRPSERAACSACSSSSRYCTNASSKSGACWRSVNSAGVPTANTRPRCINEMRSQRAASFIKWVEIKMVILSCRESLSRWRQNISRAAGSTPEVGSSRISTSGLCRQAAANCRRWRMPSERSAGRVSATSAKSNCAKASATACLPAASGIW